MFCNFIHRHMVLGRKAPTENAGLVIDAPDPWDALIDSAFWGTEIERLCRRAQENLLPTWRVALRNTTNSRPRDAQRTFVLP